MELAPSMLSHFPGPTPSRGEREFYCVESMGHLELQEKPLIEHPFIGDVNIKKMSARTARMNMIRTSLGVFLSNIIGIEAGGNNLFCLF